MPRSCAGRAGTLLRNDAGEENMRKWHVKREYRPIHALVPHGIVRKHLETPLFRLFHFTPLNEAASRLTPHALIRGNTLSGQPVLTVMGRKSPSPPARKGLTHVAPVSLLYRIFSYRVARNVIICRAMSHPWFSWY